MRLIKKKNIGNIFFKVEKYSEQLILTVSSKSKSDEHNNYAQFFFASEEELSAFAKALLDPDELD